MATNPYDAPSSAQFGEMPTRPRLISIAIWCGIVASMIEATPGVFVLAMALREDILYDIPFAQTMGGMGTDVTILFTFLATIPLALAYGIYRHSRVCAGIVLLVIFVFAAYDEISAGKIGSVELFAYAVLLALSFFGLLGTVMHHSRKKAMARPTGVA